MSIRLRYKVQLGVSSTSEENKDLGNQYYEVVSDVPGEGGSWKTTVPANTTDQPITLGNVSTLSLLTIRTNSKDASLTPVNIGVKKNSTGGEVWTIAPYASKEGIMMVTTTGITAIYLTNADASTDMEVTFTVSGD